MTARLLLLAALTLLCIACDAKIVPFRLPQNGRQVPSDILVRADGAGALQFGFEMGSGMRTYVPTHLPYVLVGVAVLAAPWWLAPLLGVSFGFGRVIMVWSSVASGSASSWATAFSARKKRIYLLCWVGAAFCVGIMVSALVA
ncbi:hypothetical protein [Micromonospora sp. DT41]|uniref:hypothetical protein n=1 Tax=Micromonospora sp. DT41 TaxID=3393437 RepID=UPI003CE72701